MSLKIKEITICLHDGIDKSNVFSQMDALLPLESEYQISWNNRIERHPFAYPSYSQLINHSIATSPTEFIIFVNDRCVLNPEEIKKMISLLENGFACVFMYNVGLMGFSKQLVRKIGWWDERYLNGGYEDNCWVLRLYEADLALYESQEGTYRYGYKSPLQNNDRCALSKPHFEKKWNISGNKIIRNLEEEKYPNWDTSLGEERLGIEESWMKSDKSLFNVANSYSKPNSGPSPSSAFYKDGIFFRKMEKL